MVSPELKNRGDGVDNEEVGRCWPGGKGMGTASKILMVGTIISIAAASALLDREFAGAPPGRSGASAPLEDLSSLADAPPAATIAYRVREGDTLEGIALRVYGDRGLSKLIRTRTHAVPKRLDAGETLLLPGIPPPTVRSRPYVVREGDSLFKIAEKVLGDGEGWRSIYDANRELLKSPFHLRRGQVLCIIDDL
jgi:nucleoid-associated protein YgaU